MVKGFYKDKDGHIIPDCLVDDAYKYFGMDYLSRMEYEADREKGTEKLNKLLGKPLIEIEPIKPLIDFTPKINLPPIEPIKPLIDFTPKIDIPLINTDPLPKITLKDNFDYDPFNLNKKSKKKPWELDLDI